MATECITEQCLTEQCITEQCIIADDVDPGFVCTDGPLVVVGTGFVCGTPVYGLKPGCTLGPYLTVKTCINPVKGGTDTGNQVTAHPPPSKKCNSEAYYCAEEHKSALLYCDNCISDKNSVVRVNGISGTTAARAICGNCSDGQIMEFIDTVTIEIDLSSERLGDAIVLFGHDLCESGSTIEVSIDDVLVDLVSHTSNPVIVDPMCSHCAGDSQCEAISIYPPEGTKGSRLKLVIDAPGTHHLDRLFWGQCCEICLEVGASDPWVASRYERNQKSSGCVIYPSSNKPKMNDGEFSFQNKSEAWMQYTMRKVIGYGEFYPMWLAISKNRRPSDVGLLVLGDVDPAVWDTQCTQSITVPYQISTHSGLPCYDFDDPESLGDIPSADDEILF